MATIRRNVRQFQAQRAVPNADAEPGGDAPGAAGPAAG
jgi:hypothetical protein